MGRDVIAQLGENGDQGTEMSGNVLEVTWLVRDRAGTQTHAILSKGGSDFKVWTPVFATPRKEVGDSGNGYLPVLHTEDL